MLELIEVQDDKEHALEIYRQLREQAFREDNSFIADSPKVVNLLLEEDIEVKSILATQAYYDTYEALIASKNIEHLYLASKRVMESIVGHKIHHNCMMHGIRPPEHPLEALGQHIIMVDEISSTENIGSIARSAAALGVNGYLIAKQGPHPFHRRALRVSMGLSSRLKIHSYSDIFTTLAYLKDAGYTIFAAEVTEDAIPLQALKVPEKWVLLMGHEGKGLSTEVVTACHKTVKIEMQEQIKSFNVSVAASILMYQLLHANS